MNTTAKPTTPKSFAEFDRRARAGESLNVVFFGGSLTWGAGASEPNATSYRALTSQQLAAEYPAAKIRFIDAAVGGTGSQIGCCRIDRDVLEFDPDLVFLDFTLNDGFEILNQQALAAYETILRRLQASGSLVLQVVMPYMQITRTTEVMARSDAHKVLARHYGNPLSDVLTAVRERVKQGTADPDAMWPTNDKTHPCDVGYGIYAEVAFATFRAAVADGTAAIVQPARLYATTYDHVTRTLLTTQPDLPRGWTRCAPCDSSTCGDFIMSRWLESVIEASPGADELRVTAQGSVVIMLAEGSENAGRYEVRIDDRAPIELSAHKDCNMHHFPVLADDLDPSVAHEVRIRPILTDGQVLRIESLCTANG